MINMKAYESEFSEGLSIKQYLGGIRPYFDITNDLRTPRSYSVLMMIREQKRLTE